MCIAVVMPVAAPLARDANKVAADPQTQAAVPDTGVRALVMARVRSKLSSRIASRVDAISVEDGDRFKKGDRLVEFNCTEARARRDRAGADHRASKQQLKSNRALAVHKAVGELDLALSEIQVQKTTAELALARDVVKRCVVSAPYDGRVVERFVNPYESVAVGQELLEILDDRELEVRVNVPSRWLAWLEVGAPLTVTVDETGRRHGAQVSRLGARIDSVSHTVQIAASIDAAPGELVAGMSGVAHFNPAR